MMTFFAAFAMGFPCIPSRFASDEGCYRFSWLDAGAILEYRPTARHPAADAMAELDRTGRKLLIVGAVCGVLAAFGWAAGFVAAKHGIEIGFTPADLAFHRFF